MTPEAKSSNSIKCPVYAIRLEKAMFFHGSSMSIVQRVVTKHRLTLLKLLISIASAIGTVHVWFLTREAILHHFSWCRTCQMIRRYQILPYLIFLVPFALIAAIYTWKKISKIDYITKVTCLSFLLVVFLYWFFDNYTHILFR